MGFAMRRATWASATSPPGMGAQGSQTVESFRADSDSFEVAERSDGPGSRLRRVAAKGVLDIVPDVDLDISATPIPGLITGPKAVSLPHALFHDGDAFAIPEDEPASALFAPYVGMSAAPTAATATGETAAPVGAVRGKVPVGSVALPVSLSDGDAFTFDECAAEDDTVSMTMTPSSALGDLLDSCNSQASQHTISITKAVGASLGLDIDLLDGKYAQVVAVKEGLIRERNEQVSVGDYISFVNGLRNNVHRQKDFLNEFKQETDLDITVIRPFEFLVSATRTGAGLGVDLVYATNSNSLLVWKVNAGFISEWNEHHPGSEVVKGDRIVAVNGTRGPSLQLLEIIKASDKVDLTFSRPALP